MTGAYPAFWLNGLPTPPSTNEQLMPSRGRLIKTARARTYQRELDLYRVQHGGKLHAISNQLRGYLDQGLVLRVDVFVVFHEERVFSCRQKKVLRIDANNRLKASLDGVTHLLGIDDSKFFRGDCEKVTTPNKDSECTIARLQPVHPRTHADLLLQMRLELKAMPIKP